jgi:hypothetical protein
MKPELILFRITQTPGGGFTKMVIESIAVFLDEPEEVLATGKHGILQNHAIMKEMKSSVLGARSAGLRRFWSLGGTKIDP